MMHCMKPGAWLALFVTPALLADERPKFDLRGHHTPIRQVVFHPDGTTLASVGQEGHIKIWDLTTRRSRRRLIPTGREIGAAQLSGIRINRSVECIAYSPDGTLLGEAAIEASRNGTVRLWDTATGKTARVLEESIRNARHLAFSPDGKLVAYNSAHPTRAAHQISLKDTATGKHVATLTDRRLAVTLLDFSSDGKYLVSAGGRKLHIWNLETKKLVRSITGHKKTIRALTIAPDGKSLATAGSGDTIRIWELPSGDKIREFNAEQEGVYSLAYSPSGETLASGGADHSAALWNPATGKRRKQLWGHSGRVQTVAFSSDGALLACGGHDAIITLWAHSESDKD